MYSGSDIEVNYIASILFDNDIRYIVENILNESISSGWANGSPYNSSIIKVIEDDMLKAKDIIDEYLKQHDNQKKSNPSTINKGKCLY